MIYQDDISAVEAKDAQVLFRLESDLLKALDEAIKAEGFGTRNEWFRAQVRRALTDGRRRELAALLERTTVDGLSEEDVVRMVRSWRARKSRP